MKRMFSVILIPALLFASVAPTYAWAAPGVSVTVDLDSGGSPFRAIDELPGPPDPRLPVDSGSDGRFPNQPGPPSGEKPDEGGEPSTTASPPVGLAPRVDSLEVLEKCLRASTLGKTAPLPVAVHDSWRARAHHRPARQDLLARRAHFYSGRLRVVAPCVQSNAPPLA